MSTVNWRVMLNKKLWKQESYVKKFTADPEVRALAQSKGAGRMVKCPKKGDRVAFVCAGEIVMVGCIDSEGFISGRWHQKHSCNDGENRPHADVEEFAWVHVKKIMDTPKPIRITGQRTWATLPSELDEWLECQLAL